jgi:2-polyprenyl-6-methoxyphenol hydroxylase-like FAD-dependent oxidoreductase
MAASARKPILISGAGISSLLLAQSLLRASIPFLIFEKNSSISFRAQGYRLRLSSEGLDSIKSVLGPEGFQRFWNQCGKTGGGGFAAIDATTGLEMTESATNNDREKIKNEGAKGLAESITSREGKIVGISRGDIRKIFMSGCELFIRWSHRVTSYELTSSGVCVVFTDGSKSVEGEMLIGRESIYSNVVKQLSQGILKTYDTGARGIHSQAPTKAFKGLGEDV